MIYKGNDYKVNFKGENLESYIRHYDLCEDEDEKEEMFSYFMFNSMESGSLFPDYIDYDSLDYDMKMDDYDQIFIEGTCTVNNLIEFFKSDSKQHNHDELFLFKLEILSAYTEIYNDDPNFKDVIQTIVDTILDTLPLIIADKDAQYIKELLENPTYKNLWFKESISALEQYAKESNLTPLQEALPQLDFE
jgi:hypothetical protein